MYNKTLHIYNVTFINVNVYLSHTRKIGYITDNQSYKVSR